MHAILFIHIQARAFCKAWRKHNISAETIRLRAAREKKRQKKNAANDEYHKANKETINRKKRERYNTLKELKTAAQPQEALESCMASTAESASHLQPKKYDWALYKRKQRARTKEQAKNQVNANKKTCKSSRTSAFSTRMSKKHKLNLAKSSLPKSPSKRVEVLAKIIESPTTRKGFSKSRGYFVSREE